jgi:hypothetical protein
MSLKRMGLFTILISIFLVGCQSRLAVNQPVKQGPYTVNISWAASHEKALNTVGGGYKIYYSQTSGANLATTSFINVPYVSGGTAPTTTSISVAQWGTWYVRVVGYSALNAPGQSNGSTSPPSTEVSISVP